MRAVAVIPVVLFHLNPRLAPGGFIGVDVFFVISGFLITSIILRETGNGTFTLRNFWLRRIRRLFPALAAVLFASLLAGCIILYRQEWQALGSQLTAVLLLAANFHLHQETGDYWGPAAEEVPLLHTWSLAVEEQFYLLFPLFLLVLLRLGKHSLLPALGLGAIASLAHGIFSTNSDPGYAFYLLPTRAWELLVGCLLATWNWRTPTRLANQSWSNILAILGLGAVVASCFLITRDDDFPGYVALLPTVGTGLVIALTHHERNLVKTLLSASPLVFVGKISYSLYLWHWPVIVFWRLHTMESQAALRHALPILLVSFAAATLCYFFVEKPFRRPFPLLSPKFSVIAAAFLCLFAITFASRGNLLRSFASPSFEPSSFSSQLYDANLDEAWRNGGIIVGEGSPELVVIGSSHALMYSSTVAKLSREQDRTVAFLCLGNAFGRFHTDGDHAIFRDGLATQRHEFDHARLKHLASWRAPQIFWMGRWDIQYEILGPVEFDRLIRKSLGILLAHTEQVTLFTQPPFSMDRRGSLLRFATTLQRKGLPVIGRESADRTAFRSAANHTLHQIALDLPRVDLVELAAPFELEPGRTRILSEDEGLLYHDYDHLSDHGAARVRDRIAKAIRPNP